MEVPIKQAILAAILRRSEAEAAILAGEFVRAAEQEREAVLAALEFEQWMAESCRDCLSHERTRR